MKRRAFSIALYDGTSVPCTGWEFDAGDGIMLVVHRVLLERPDKFGDRWDVSDPISGRHIGGMHGATRAKAIHAARAQVARRGADHVRATLEQRRPKALRDYLFQHMVACGITKIETPLFSIRLADNPPSVEIFDADMVPAQYVVQPEPPPARIDKRALAEAMKAGEVVPGVRLVQNKRMVVR